MSNYSNQIVRLRERLPSDISGQVTDSLSRIAEQLTDVAQDWSTRAKSAARNTDSYVRTSPWQALGVVALISLAAGIFATRQAQQARLLRRAEADHREMAGG